MFIIINGQEYGQFLSINYNSFQFILIQQIVSRIVGINNTVTYSVFDSISFITKSQSKWHLQKEAVVSFEK